jgi:hypothetical protein
MTWKERVPVIRTTYRVEYRGRFCGDEYWTEMVCEEEDFDRP